MQIGNNNQYEDWEKGIKVEKSNLSKTILELTFFAKSKKEFETILKSKDKIKKMVDKAKTEMGYASVFGRFAFGKFNPTEAEQKDIINLQNNVFDVLSVQLIKEDFDVLKRMIQYSKSLKQDISPVIDLDIGVVLLLQIIPYLIETNPEHIRFIYHKPTKYIRHYEAVYSSLKEKNIKYYAVNCTKRCGLFYENVDARNIATAVILKLAYGFDGCCSVYSPARKRKDGKRGFPSGDIYKFDINTYEFVKVPNKDFRKNRFGDFLNMQNLDLSKEAIQSKPKIKLLLAHLQKEIA